MDRSTIFINLLICIYCLIHCCNGADYGDSCSSLTDCVSDTYQTCDSNNTCVCENGYSENGVGDGCVADELGMDCNTNVGCAGTAATCTDDKCSCITTTHYDSNGGASGGACTPRIALGAECTEPPSINLQGSDLCSDPNSECRHEISSSLYKCLCGTWFSNTGGQCVQSVDGVWTDWTSWTNCSVTCGGGSQSRSRSCNNPAPANGGSNCTGDSTKSQGCNEQPCPIDGGWTAWSNWTSCSVTCNGGNQSRSRSCTNPAPEHNGSDCTGVSTKSRDCNTVKCPVPYGGSCTVGTDTCAGDYTGCSDGGTCQCVSGYYWNNAACVAKVSLGAVCPSTVSSTAPCTNTHDTCQQDGSTYRCRCTSDYYDTNGNNNNGGQCTKKVSLGAVCPNPTNSGVSSTVPCSDTYATCQQNGSTYRCRCISDYYDDNGDNNNGGQCTRKVSLGAVCPNPNIGVSSTASCTDTHATCQQEGSTSTYRCRCTNNYYDNNGYNVNGGQCSLKVQLDNACPAPTDNVPATVTCIDSEATCVSDDSNGYKCKCPSDYYDNNGNTAGGECKQIDGEWSPWASCSATCGSGSQSRNRSCNNPDLEHGGSDCIGDSAESRNCNTERCPVNGGWTAWTEWSSCSASCGDGSWTRWTSCSVICGGGSQSRSRSCNNPSPGTGVNNCIGDSTSSQSCNTQKCPIVSYGYQCTVGGDKCAGDNTVCSGGTCQCISGYYWYNETCVAQVALGDSCPSTVPSSIPCIDSNAECTNMCSGNSCQCKSGFYDTDGYTGNIGGKCEAELKCKDSTTDTKSIIVGVVLGMIILLLIGYSGYITLRLRRANLKQEQLRTSPNANTQPTYVNQMFENVAMPSNSVEDNDNPENVYTSLNDETRAEKSTYELI